MTTSMPLPANIADLTVNRHNTMNFNISVFYAQLFSILDLIVIVIDFALTMSSRR